LEAWLLRPSSAEGNSSRDFPSSRREFDDVKAFA
jgi:hypothetical protein